MSAHTRTLWWWCCLDRNMYSVDTNFVVAAVEYVVVVVGVWVSSELLYWVYVTLHTIPVAPDYQIFVLAS